MHALDRDFIRDRIWFGLRRAGDRPDPLDHPASTKRTSRNTRYDPDKAKALLDEMGLKPGRRRRARQDHSRPALWRDLGPAGRVHQAVAARKVGIEVTLASTDVAGWGRRVSNWDYRDDRQLRLPVRHPSLGVARTYISDNIRKGVLFTNTVGLFEPGGRRAVRQGGRRERSRRSVTRCSHEVQKILVEDVAVVWLVEMEFPTFLDKQVQQRRDDRDRPSENFADVSGREK